MKPVFLTSLNRKRRQAMALILVIITVALLSMLIVAIFSITRTEYKATQSYVAARSAKQLGDSAVAIVEAQIQNAQNTLTGSARKTHATQPGMVRVYQPDGRFESAFKLYSSANMKVTGDESSLYGDTHVPPSNWHTLPGRFVDLNEPVVRPALSSSGTTAASTYAVYFPIIDPRAAWNYTGSQSAGAAGETTTQVEGFSYTKTSPNIGTGGGQDYSSQVVTPTDASSPDRLRLPMPVEWMYVLQDGTLGTLDSTNKFLAATGSTGGGGGSTGGIPSAINPIVGRVAFWTDDESCKININTASEPTFSSTPFYYHERDVKWAHFPPVTGEYQRYPGHPATVALSAVLAPNFLLDPLLPDVDGLSTAMDVVNIKEQIYKFAPKIAGGGSEAGTRPFTRDDFSSDKGEREAALKINLESAVKERLFASVDEMLFADLDYNITTGRSPAILTLPGGSGNFFAQERLEHSRFFLTAHSRSPEFSIHGLPRICMWPVADESKGAQFRSSFDNAIALCATIKREAASSTSTTRSYFFRRANSLRFSAEGIKHNADVDITRNSLLMDYLTDQMSSLQYPATSYSSTTTNSTFRAKYGSDNVNQLAVQFFDYIRCTNLYDGITARKNDAWAANSVSVNPSHTLRYIYRDNNENRHYTFTHPRISEPPTTLNNVTAEQGIDYRRSSGGGGVLPGHGQVTPSIWAKGGRSYKGFGRMFTISEIGFQFMCTADGAAAGRGLDLTEVTFPAGMSGDGGSGGAVARRYDFDIGNQDPTPKIAYPGQKVPEIDLDTPPDGIPDAVWYSNFPPLVDEADVQKMIPIYGTLPFIEEWHPKYHPGFDPKNWNMTLARATPLLPNQKRVQVMLALEAFCPSVGWTGIYPEFTIVLDGNTIGQMTLNGTRLFNTTGDVAIKSNGNIFTAEHCHMSGGHATPSAIAGGRRTRSISNGGGIVMMPADVNYDDSNTSDHQALQNFQFVSDFITVDRDQKMQVVFPSEDIKIRIYDTHMWGNAQPVQTLYVNFGNVPSTQIPVPDLAQSQRYKESISTTGRITYTRTQYGPHFWAANYNGCIGLMQGSFNPEYDGLTPGMSPWREEPKPRDTTDAGDSAGGRFGQGIRGRLDTTARLQDDNRPDIDPRALSVIVEGDVVRTLVPAVGDYRTLAAMYEVPASWWKPHPLWRPGLNDLKMAHSFTGFWANAEEGAKIAVDITSVQAGAPDPDYGTTYKKELQLIGGARFDLDRKGNAFKSLSGRNADLPPDPDYASAANAFGDFDTGVSSAREGPYINKPDEGNFYAGLQNASGGNRYWRSAYFAETYENADDWRSGIFITPNRLISSPVMFGSLPTGVFPTNGLPKATDRASGLGTLDYAPWQTLLFRPHAQVNSENPVSNSSHPGLQDPSDHYLLDLFFMPVVEPYAISEPLSVAGRINMNYQIMPFINIRRATAMHAVMKGEYITAIPTNQIVAAKDYYPGGQSLLWNERFWNDEQDNKYWHRPIDPRTTLRQFDLKFSHQSGGNDNYQGLFRSASQICEMHLIPKIVNRGDIINPDDVTNAASQTSINTTMNNFWASNRPTGDNVRERPYSNLYARLTTRSNTFRVHVRSQVLRKARSTAADTFDPDKDAVNGEYRGSYLVERYIDPNDPTVTIPDYAASGGLSNSDPLDTFYRFRTLETKRFNP